MNFVPEKIDHYATSHTGEEPELLAQLSAETLQKVLNPRMLSSKLQGRLLAMISKLVQPRAILEIGTYTGYSALCLAEGIQKNGLLHTIDCNEELVDFQSKYFHQSPFGKQIKQHLGNALDIIPNLSEKFDLIFIDADKENYINYFYAIIDKMNPGGVILSDNVLWYGKVTEPLEKNDEATAILVKYNQLLRDDARIESVLLPIRDGITISRVR